MASKNREYKVTAGPSWFSFWPPIPPPVRDKVEPSPTYSVPKPLRHPKMPAISEEPNRSKSPTVSKSRAGTLSKRETNKADMNVPEIKVTEPEDSEPWSEWYVGEDRQHLWRARQLPDGTWDYEYRPLEGQPGQPRSRSQETTTTTTTYMTHSSQSADAPFYPGLSPPASSLGRGPRARSSPKTSYPTIITTSTGRPTERYPTSSPRASDFLVKEDLPILTITAGPEPSSSLPAPPTFQSLVVPQQTRLPIHPKRPVGPVMWLLQEGARSRKSNKSGSANITTTKLFSPDSFTLPIGGHDDDPLNPGHPPVQAPPGQQQQQPTPQQIAQITKTRTAYAKKLDKKIKSEKVTRMDPRKRIKTWLKQVSAQTNPQNILIPLDEDGFPVYR
ncbi:hypothetical protein QBC43DRAFT_356707 [Cladorrhinum sp. PSN259]|nr:hypothetical protein QBC43DRAFT_356707 [Cladorrhinum sp. PSN259]